MIRCFEYGDQDRLDPNQFSDCSQHSDYFSNDDIKKFTLVDGGHVKCILCWMEYVPKEYLIFFLMPENISLRHARALKNFMNNAGVDLKPKSCMTYSQDCSALERWHEFFGFVFSGEIVEMKGKLFKRWELSWV